MIRERARRCTTADEARAEVTRLMAGIAGFEHCTVHSVTREDDGWLALIDDPADEFEYSQFGIGDDGSMDWT